MEQEPMKKYSTISNFPGKKRSIRTYSKMELVQNESGRIIKRQVDYYNLDMLISVGYRISSLKGTKLRK